MKNIYTHVYLLTISVSPHYCFGVLSMLSNGGEHCGVNYLPHRNILFQYYDNDNPIYR